MYLTWEQLIDRIKKNGGDTTICPVCKRPFHIDKTTNADRIRAMTDEELAEWIADKVADVGEFKQCVVEWLDWLKQETSK